MSSESDFNPDRSVWPGTRPPINNPLLIKQKMDAAWGRGKYRSEIWNDQVNPLNDWWMAFTPSDEEVEAAKWGFDFADPKGWCEARGIDYDKAMEEKEGAQQAAVKKLEEEEQRIADMDMNEVQEQFFKWQEIAYLKAFREQDDVLQKQKNQIPLDTEDTGVQYQNEKAKVSK
jgi:predicted RNase H-like HicB family nuclease